jgi:hypothetical protein
MMKISWWMTTTTMMKTTMRDPRSDEHQREVLERPPNAADAELLTKILSMTKTQRMRGEGEEETEDNKCQTMMMMMTLMQLMKNLAGE